MYLHIAVLSKHFISSYVASLVVLHRPVSCTCKQSVNFGTFRTITTILEENKLINTVWLYVGYNKLFFHQFHTFWNNQRLGQ